LGDILTREQERQYNAAIDQSLARAQNSLNAIASRQLTKEQKAVVAQIQSFVQQAQTTRKSSLSGARSLAERAEVLARDLAGSLH
jgi:cob(I)alamin adenosyltransferase